MYQLMIAQNTLRTRDKKQVFFIIHFKFDDAADVNKCRNQIKFSSLALFTIYLR